MKLQQATTALLALVAIIAPVQSQLQAQQQSRITVDGKNYVVTEYPKSPYVPTHMVMLSGPAGNGMITVDNNDKITAIISPPGGLLNGVDYGPVINKVWTTYLAQKGGNATNAAAGQAQSPGALTVDGVISLLNAKISDDLVIAKIQKSGQTFDLSTDDMVRLKKAGASDAVIKALMSAAPASAAVAPATPMAAPSGAAAPAAAAAPNPVAENPSMGKLQKQGFMSSIGHGISNAATGKTVIDQLSMRNILPQWDPNRKLSEQYPHIAITVLSAPMGWTDDYRTMVQKNNNNKLIQSCFKLKAVVWLDASRSKTTDDFDWCVEKDMFMSELQPTYLYSLAPTKADYGQTSGINRTDGPQPPDKLLPNDRATLDMEAKTNPQGASKDLNLDELSLFAIMFANVRKDLGETLGSDGDYRVWITGIKKAAGPSLF